VASSQRKQPSCITVLLYIVLCVVLFSSCSTGNGGTPSPVPTPYKPFLALHICGDNTASYPQQFLQEAARNIADRIDSDVLPNRGGMFVDFSLIEVNSLQNTYVSFSVPAIPALPPKPQAGSDPYKYATALRDWKKQVASINALIASVRASIKPSLDKLRSIHLQEVGGTDIPGCADTAADEFSYITNGSKVLLYVSDMQSNVDMQLSKHINLHGAIVRTIYRVCQVQSACEQNDAYWSKQFKAWDASSYTAYSPAQSSAEHITY
jgi:hypothetical protein